MTLFYKLTTDTANKLLNANLPRSSWELWTWLTTLDPFGNQTIPLSWEKAHEAIGISKTTFYRALKTLINSGLLISRKIAHFCVSFKNGTQDPEEKIESQKSSSEFQNCDPSLYIDLEINKILSENENEKKAENTPEPDSKPVGQNSPAMAKVIQTAPADPIALGEEKFSAAGCTKKYTKGFDWLSEGPWNIEGKLDPNFRDYIANDWLKRFGGDIHAKRADVLAHFKKDPANLAIRWEQYQSEFLNRVQNTQILLSQGVQVKPETQELLLTNHRALTAELPAELNPVAPIAETSPTIAVPGPIANLSEAPALAPEGVTELSQEPEAIAPAHADGQEPEAETPSKKFITSPKPLVKSSSLPQTPSKNPEAVTTEDGQCLKVFKRQEQEDDRDPGKLRAMVQGFLKGFGGGQTPSKKFQAQTQLEKLNGWLHDPLLRDNTIAWVNRSESFKYCPDLDQIIEAEEF